MGPELTPGAGSGDSGAGLGRHLRAVLLLPFLVTIALPSVLLLVTHVADLGWSLPAGWRLLSEVARVALIFLGAILIIGTIRLFATVGKGILAPWDPTQRLVVRGVYRFVRSPIIGCILAILLGEVLLTRPAFLFGWFVACLITNLVYIPQVEEPNLLQRFGEPYRRYANYVPRWVPRPRPWGDPAGR